MQNTSHAVMAQRHEPMESRDDFPTPPWATRALINKVIMPSTGTLGETCLEPACGRGYMSKVLEESFSFVKSSDTFNYGYGDVRNFLTSPYPEKSFDWVITNPPFKYAEVFIDAALDVAKIGVAILARTVFLESVGRYSRLFLKRPPSIFAQFVERVPMVKGRVDPKATTATGYAWFVWRVDEKTVPRLTWIPPCRRELERASDYGQ